jgi:hypothetical protein
MRSGREQNGCQPRTDSRSLSAIDHLLIAAIKLGPAKKREAINRILELVPHWTRENCWRRIKQLRNTPELAVPKACHPDKTKKPRKTRPVGRSSGSPWTPEDDEKLFKLAGYEPAKRIAQRLGRSVRAVRFRLGALGISAKVTDGWSLWDLRKMLRISTNRLRYLIGNGMLKVRDPRVSASSLGAFCNKIRNSLESSATERIAAALASGDDAYSWERTANLLGVPVAQVQVWISAGRLRVLDAFVTDRAFEEFCKKHGEEIYMALLDPPTAKWLVSEYGVQEIKTNGCKISQTLRHALVTRTCLCGRKIAGNPYFLHVRACRSAGAAARGDPSNTREPGSRRFPNVQSSKST